LFSAAIPGQGGDGHLNEQWPAYWIERFVARGLKCFDRIRPLIWQNSGISTWYRQNMLLFMRDVPHSNGDDWRGAPLVHPEYFNQPIRYRRSLENLTRLLRGQPLSAPGFRNTT
jgi:hypothetical protein